MVDIVTTEVETSVPKRVSWGAIFAGTFISLVVLITLGLLGMAIGLGFTNPAERGELKGFGIWSGIWWFIVFLISLFIGGWVAGRLSGVDRRIDAMLHGAVTWAVSILVIFFLLTTTLGKVIGGTMSTLTQSLATAAAPAIQERAYDGEDGTATTPTTPGATDQSNIDQQARETGRQAVEKAKQVAEPAANVAAWTAFFSFLVLALACVAAAFGGRVGLPHYHDRGYHTGRERPIERP